MQRKQILSAVALIAVFMTSGSAAQEPEPGVESAPTPAASAAPGEYPRARQIEGATMIVHAPQIRTWEDFGHFTSELAIEILPTGTEQRFLGAAILEGDTEVKLDEHIVIVTQPRIDKVTFTDPAANDPWAGRVQAAVIQSKIDVPVDIFLSYISQDLIDAATPEGFNAEPPPIYVRETPAIIVLIEGDPIEANIPGASLQLIPNASFPIVKDPADGRYYLLSAPQWLVAPDLKGPWSATAELPMSFSQIPADAGLDQLRTHLPPKASDDPAPEVIISRTPAELIVTTGAPEAEAIAGADGLEYVKNTTSPLFRLAADWYFLASGRWFTTTQLDTGKWTFVPKLPAAFASIPDDGPQAYIRASVAGTPEARLALLEARLPKKATIASDAKADADVTYAGDPEYETIKGTKISRATNTDFNVLRYADTNYLCYQGAWYTGPTATGPWLPAAQVPTEFYQIPPDSPAYPCTYVRVESATSTTIVYSSTPAYWDNVYLAYGIPVYGTGWYYPPYIYGPYYYPYRGTYGYGSWYNPVTGGYGSRSVWYGPYGGYTYAQGYNPRTGRYGYMEGSWDNDGWRSEGETYNPRTGVSTETTRKYSDDKQRYTQDRTIEKGDKSMNVKRTRDYDGNWSSVEANTKAGGSFNTKREFDDGTMTGSGSIKTADGRSADFNSEISGGQAKLDVSGSEGGSGSITRDIGPGGVTREGEFSKGGETVNTSTQRVGATSRTEIQSSAGGSAISTANRQGRTTVGQSASGDLYAGQNGNVYRRTDDGWQQHTGNGWQNTDRQGPRAQGGLAGQRGMNTSRLNRDFNSRQSGFQRHNQRSQFGRSGGRGFRQAGGMGRRGGGAGGRRGGRR